ncbi:acetate--CoA ligase [Fulvimarina endophytica]|uniref:Acetyl-coenzyme A synthetase n=1 Tax=Fulvimarina endophytica TaxID=2293836 RepID=A0A371X020_9HYPH|nr:acetate--CoA ligase [Fulvimarina endophytica]RFC62562.1 acetate--CoA ligase [Fulvimarina endophytica]
MTMIEVKDAWKSRSKIDAATYEEWYKRSVEDPEGFWKEHAKRIDWIEEPTKIKSIDFTYPDVSIKWFEDGTLNACYNCVDRHLKDRGDQTAILWEADEPGNAQHISYKQLHEHVSKFANVLKELGVGKGDRVVIYLPMIPQAVYAMLACARIGAIHSVVFAGFSPQALRDRVNDSDAKLVITADHAPRGGKATPLKKNADKAFEGIEGDVKCLVVKRTGDETPITEGRDFWLHEMEDKVSDECECEPMNAEDPLFILYTSGSTGKPKGVVHTTGGYLVYTSMTHEYVFDYHKGDIYWCTADVGWITGHSYIVYGPLANGATTLVFESTPTYPDASRCWKVCEEHKVNQFYTAPTAIRALMGKGREHVSGHDLSALKLLGTVGEPINPEAWQWYFKEVGQSEVPIVDTYWQTETGGILITPLPGATALKPGSACKPFFGIRPVILEPQSGEVLEGNGVEGVIAIADSWPSQMRTVYKNHERFANTYFQQYKGYYFTEDGAKRDEDGYIWITGRVDDVINVSGHRMGTAEVESALVAHEAVSEAAVVGYPHEVKGQGIYCYVTLMDGTEPSDKLRDELVAHVRSEIGPIAKPDAIQFAPDMPKTRSGKIMRRVLRKIAEDKLDELGDTSTLADPSVVDHLIENRQNKNGKAAG